MHRETLSRTILFSHNFLGKSSLSLAPLTVRGTTGLIGKLLPSVQNSVITSSSRCYHQSWENAAQSITLSKAISESKDGVGKPSLSTEEILEEKSSNTVSLPRLQFNLKARDILSIPDNPDDADVQTGNILEVEGSSVVSEEKSLLEKKIFTSFSIEELLDFSNEEQLTLKHACLIISRLGHIAIMRPESYSKNTMKIQSDKRFIRLLNLIQRGNHSQFPHTLLQALNGLQKLKLENSPEVSMLLERELSWSMRRCPLRFLAKSVAILHANSTADKKTIGAKKDEGVLRSAIQVLHRRWIEAISGIDFVSLFKVIELFDNDRKMKIEERAADLVQQFTPQEMAQMFIILGTKKRRPTPLLRALSYHYSKAEYGVSVKDTIELIYALNELTFADPVLMNRVCTDLSEAIPSIRNVTQISSLMTSLGQMRYRHKDILFAVDEWITKHLNELRVFDFAVWLQSSATLDHQSQNLASFCDLAQRNLTQPTSSSPTEWVNIVHSFVVLNKLNTEMLSSVLNPSFVDSIDRHGVKSTRQKVKLLNLNYLANRLPKKDYPGPFLAESKVKEWSTAYVNSSDEKLSQLVAETLGNFLPAAKYLELNCQLESGVFVDAKLYVDSKMKPVTLEVAKMKPSTSKPIAVVVEGYSALCLGQKQRTGQTCLNTKILEQEQYLVINVPYTEFGYSDKLVRRVQYLEQKIKGISHSSEQVEKNL